MDDWQRQVTEEVHGSELPLVDPVASMGSSSKLSLLFIKNSNRQVISRMEELIIAVKTS